MKPIRKRFMDLPAFLLILFFVSIGLQASWDCSAAAKEKLASSDVNFWLKELKNRKPVARRASKAVRLARTESQATGIDGVSGKVTARSKKLRNEKAKKGPKKISVDFYKVDLHNVFRLLGQVSGKNVVVDEGVKGTLTLALDNVPWTFVLEVIKNLKGLDSIERNNTIMIYPKKKSIQWVGDNGTGGTLETQPAVVEVTGRTTSGVSKAKRLLIDKKRKSKTPLKHIIKAEKLIKKAASQEKHGNLMGAYENLKKAANLWPDNQELNRKLAAIALQQDDPLSAFNYAKEALKIDSRDGEAAAIAAVALARLDRVKDAHAYFEMAISEKPSRDILWNYAVFAFSQGDYRQALRLINRLEANYKVDPDIIMLKAQCYEYLAKTPQAITEYKTILSAGPSVPADMVSFAQLRLKALTGSGYSGQ